MQSDSPVNEKFFRGVGSQLTRPLHQHQQYQQPIEGPTSATGPLRKSVAAIVALASTGALLWETHKEKLRGRLVEITAVRKPQHEQTCASPLVTKINFFWSHPQPCLQKDSASGLVLTAQQKEIKAMIDSLNQSLRDDHQRKTQTLQLRQRLTQRLNTLKGSVDNRNEGTVLRSLRHPVFVSHAGRPRNEKKTQWRFCWGSSSTVNDDASTTKAAQFAAFLHRDLQDNHGVPTFLDSRAISWGDPWQRVILDNAQNCKVFVAVLTPDYFKCFWCLYELDQAIQSGCTIFPIHYHKNSGASSSIPRDTAALRRSLRKMLLQKGFSTNENVNQHVDRWCDNIDVLRKTHGPFKDNFHKHADVPFVEDVAREIAGIVLPVSPPPPSSSSSLWGLPTSLLRIHYATQTFI